MKSFYQKPGSKNRSLLKTTLTLLLAACCISATTLAQTTITAIQTGPWNDPNTWDESVVPGAGDDVIISGGYIVIVNSSGESCNSLIIGYGDPENGGTLAFSGSASLTVAGDIRMGDINGAVGTISLSENATLTCASVTEDDPTYSGVYETNLGTMVFTGTFTLPYNLFQFNNLTISSGTTTTGGRNLPIEGNLSVLNGATLDLLESTANRNTIGGTLSIASGGKLKIGGGGTIPANFSTHSIGATSTIEYAGVSQTVATLNSSQNYGHLIISGSGLKEVNGTINIAGDLTLNGGIFSVNTFTANRTSAGGILTVADGATLRISGSGTLPSNFSTHSIGATSTIEYNGTSAQNVATLNSGQDYGNLTVTNQAKTLQGNTRVRGNLTFGGTPNRLLLNGYTLTLEGNISGSNSSRTFSGSTSSNLVLNGNFNRTLFFENTTPGTTNALNNITLNHNGNVTTLGSDLVVNGAATFTAGKLSISSRTLTIKGSLVNTVSGGLRGGSSSNLIFNGSVSPTLSMDQTTAGTTNVLNNLTINSNGQVITMGNDLQVNGTTTFTDGKLAINGNTLTIRGAVTNTVSGGIRGGSTSNITFSSTTTNASLSFDQTTPGTTNVIKNFTVNASGRTVTLLDALRLVGTHTPTAGVLASDGNYTIASTASGTANIAAGSASGGYITGDVTVERFIPQNTNRAWRLLAAPTSGQTIKQSWQEDQSAGVDGVSGYGTNITSNLTDWQTAGFDFKTPANSLLRYESSTDQLIGIDNTNTPISGEQGYFIYIRGSRSVTPSTSIASVNSTTLRTKGTLYTGNQSAINVAADQYAVIGNPYASALDVRNITLSGGLSEGAFYVWDPKLLGSYNLGGYQTLAPNGGNYIVIPGGGSYGSTGSTVNTIQSGAAFFVTAVGSSGSITINESSKTSGSSMVFRPGSPTNLPAQTFITNLYAVSGGINKLADGNGVFFDDQYAPEVDGNDNRKLSNFGENFSLMRGTQELVVERRPQVSSTDTLFFEMYQLKRITYQLEFFGQNFAQAGTTAYLIDQYLNTETPLNLLDTTRYAFTVDANAGSSDRKRFKVVFRAAGVLPVTVTSFKAYPLSGNVELAWEVTNQINLRSYVVEHSKDGRIYTPLADVQAVNNTSNYIAYKWTHVSVDAGNHFYRIKCVDNNGDFKYTRTVKVVVGRGESNVTVSPNPVSGNIMNLQFGNMERGVYSLRLINAGGQTCWNTTISHPGGSSNLPVEVPANIANGIYQMVFSGGKQNMTQRVVIQKR